MLTKQAADAGRGAASRLAVGANRFGANKQLKYAAAIVVAALVAAAIIGWSRVAGRAAVPYTVAPVTVGQISRAVTSTGTVNPVLTIIVGSYDSGPIQQLYCDYNTRVRQGQICAKIDPRPYQTIVDQNKANLGVAKAQLEKDKANLAYWKLNSDRLTNLAKTQAVSQDQADNARNNYDQALATITYDEATIEQHQAQLEAALVNLEYTNIVSPVSGTVVSRNVTAGQTVAASFQTPTLFLIARDLTQMEVDANVSESDIGGVEEGNRATFTVDAFPKRVFEGIVAQVRQSPQTVQNVVTFAVVISTSNKDLSLKPGLTAATRIVVDEREDAVRVPDLAFRYKPSQAGIAAMAPREGTFLWVLRDGKPVAVPVKTGLDDDSFTEVLGGLKPGDQVVVGEPSARARVPPPRL